jgi:hypothetical protein
LVVCRLLGLELQVAVTHGDLLEGIRFWLLVHNDRRLHVRVIFFTVLVGLLLLSLVHLLYNQLF